MRETLNFAATLIPLIEQEIDKAIATEIGNPQVMQPNDLRKISY
jgi:hypothetical protein